MKLRKGDPVKIIAGKDTGRESVISKVLPAKGKVQVEGINTAKRHTKPRGAGKESGILEKEAPLHISKVALWDPEANKGVRVGIRRSKDGKTRERISKASDNDRVVGG